MAINKLQVSIILFVLLFLLVPKYFFSPVKLDVELDITTKELLEGEIIVFNSKDQTKVTSYVKVIKSEVINVIDQEVWGFCYKGPDENIQVKIKSEIIPLYPTSDVGCSLKTEIKRFNEKIYSLASVISALIAAGIILITMLFLYHSLRKEKIFHKENIKFKITFLVFCISQFIYFLITYPGLYNSDFTHVAFLVKSGIYNEWFSLLIPLLVSAFFKMGLDVGTIQIPFLLTFTYISYLYYELAKSIGMPYWASLFLLILFALPSLGLLNNFLTRDAIVLNCHIFLLYLLLNIKYGVRSIKYDKYVFIAFALISGIIRREGFIFFGLMIYLYTYFKGYRVKPKIKIIAGTFAVYFFMNFMGKVIVTNKNDISTKEKITITLAHYIGSIISEDYRTFNKEKDMEIINKYFDAEILKKFHVHYDTLGLHYGARKYNGQIELADLFKLSIKLIKDNPILFFKGRLKMFEVILFPNKNLYTVADEYGDYMERDIHLPYLRDLLTENILDPFGVRTNKTISKMREFLISPKINFLYSLFFSLLILIYCLILFKNFQDFSVISIPFVAKTFIMFMLIPKAQFQYFADIYLAGLVLSPFLAFEFYKRKKGFMERSVVQNKFI